MTRRFLGLGIIICTLLTVFGCKKEEEFLSNDDLKAQNAYMQLLDLTYNTFQNETKQRFIDSILTLRLPDTLKTIKSYEVGGYVEKGIIIKPIDQQLEFFYNVKELQFSVSKNSCFLSSTDIDFSMEDFIINVVPCISEVYHKIKDEFESKFPKGYRIDTRLFNEFNNLLKKQGVEMAMIHTYSDSYHFIFFDVKNKKNVYSTFESLGIQVGDENTFFDWDL